MCGSDVLARTMVSQRIASVKSKSLKRAKRNHLLKHPHRSSGVAVRSCVACGRNDSAESRGNSKQLRCLKFDACYNRKRFYFC